MTYTVAGVQRDISVAITECQKGNFIGQLPREILFHLINIINNSENQAGLIFFSWTCTGAYILRNLFFLDYEADKSKLFSNICDHRMIFQTHELSSDQATCLQANTRSSYVTSLFLNENLKALTSTYAVLNKKIPEGLLYQDDTWRIFWGKDDTLEIIKKGETKPRRISFSKTDIIFNKPLLEIEGRLYIAKGFFFLWNDTTIMVVNLENTHPHDRFDFWCSHSIMHSWVDFNYLAKESSMVLNILMRRPGDIIHMWSFRGLSSDRMTQLQEMRLERSKIEAIKHIIEESRRSDDEKIRRLDAAVPQQEVVPSVEEIPATAEIPGSVMDALARQLQEPAQGVSEDSLATNSIDSPSRRNERLEQFNTLASRVELIEVENRPPSTGKVILIAGVVFLALVVVTTEVLLILQPGRVIYQGNGIILTLPMILTLSMGGSISLATIAIGSYRWWKTER